MTETATMTNMSERGILFQSRRLVHSKVAMTTMNMTPMSAGMGMRPMHDQRGGKMMNARRQSAAVMPESR